MVPRQLVWMLKHVLEHIDSMLTSVEVHPEAMEAAKTHVEAASLEQAANCRRAIA